MRRRLMEARMIAAGFFAAAAACIIETPRNPTEVINSAQTIILTGATGYLRSRVLDRLLRRGDRVIALVRDASKLRRRDPGLTVVEGDLRGPLPAGDLRADALVHAAACIDFDAGLDALMEVNRDGTRRIAE